jgi:hypothetical protein
MQRNEACYRGASEEDGVRAALETVFTSTSSFRGHITHPRVAVWCGVVRDGAYPGAYPLRKIPKDTAKDRGMKKDNTEHAH